MARRVVSGILFYPRGGSAYTARAIANGLRSRGWSVTLVAGSRSDLGANGDAGAFYGDVHPVSFDQALAGEDPFCFEGAPGTAPLQPSYEDRPGAPDKVFAALDDLDYERQVRAWCRELERVGAPEADVLHLHHLTPLNEAARRVAPHVPLVGQLHGTELLMLEQIAAGAPEGWRHAERWAARMRRWAQACSRLIAAPSGVARAQGLLEVPSERIVAIPNGVDTDIFSPREVDRAAIWDRVLVEEPRGWLPHESPGSAHYEHAQVAELSGGAVLLYVGRFTAVKRLDRLIGAFAKAKRQLRSPAGLVLIGGHPGEWEGEHPAQLADRLGVRHVFLAGWYQHEELAEVLAAGDAVVVASEREQFGQVLVEGMACGLPVLATRSLGPELIVEDGRTGWLTEADEDALAGAIIDAVEDPAERARRGTEARRAAASRFSWSGISDRSAAVLEDVIASESGPVRSRAQQPPDIGHGA